MFCMYYPALVGRMGPPDTAILILVGKSSIRDLDIELMCTVSGFRYGVQINCGAEWRLWRGLEW